jgi:hypothetical protein
MSFMDTIFLPVFSCRLAGAADRRERMSGLAGNLFGPSMLAQ